MSVSGSRAKRRGWHPCNGFSLEEQAGKILRSRVNVPVYIKADHALDYGAVVRVMTVLQKAGAESVGLITDPPTIES